MRQSKSSASDHSEELLWQMFIAGDDAAFETLFIQNYPKLFQYGRKYSGDEEFIKDAIQELFADLWLRRRNLGHTVSVRHYLYKSLRRKMLRLKSQILETTPLMEETNQFVLTLSPEHLLINDELAASQQVQMTKWLSYLTPRQREAISLRFYHELSYEEIASVMEVENHTIRNLIYEALKVLRKRLAMLLIGLIMPIL